jgi:choline dehydrogenase-like flavoprotein
MNTDVIVVGAGPTGLMLACELALAGVRTRILERRTEPHISYRIRRSQSQAIDPRTLARNSSSCGEPRPRSHAAAGGALARGSRWADAISDRRRG